jgi:hypothetical protein
MSSPWGTAYLVLEVELKRRRPVVACAGGNPCHAQLQLLFQAVLLHLPQVVGTLCPQQCRLRRTASCCSGGCRLELSALSVEIPPVHHCRGGYGVSRLLPSRATTKKSATNNQDWREPIDRLLRHQASPNVSRVSLERLSTINGFSRWSGRRIQSTVFECQEKVTKQSRRSVVYKSIPGS